MLKKKPYVSVYEGKKNEGKKYCLKPQRKKYFVVKKQ